MGGRSEGDSTHSEIRANLKGIPASAARRKKLLAANDE